MAEIEHKLHEKVGELLDKYANEKKLEAKLDKACGGKQQIPLFLDEKNRENNFCKVDAILIREKEVIAVIEIEESKDDPTIIFGKCFTTAMSNYYIGNEDNMKIWLAKFIQIIDTKTLEKHSRKIEQFKLIEQEINKHLCGNVNSYKIIYVDGEKIKENDYENKDFKEFKKEFYDALEGKSPASK